MRSLVPPGASSETFVLFAELLILLLEVCFLLLKFINAIFESSDPLKQLLRAVSDHHNSPRSVQTTRDGLPAGDRPSRTPCRLHCSTVGSGATYESVAKSFWGKTRTHALTSTVTNTNREWLLAERPAGEPDMDSFELRETDVPSPAPGELLVRTRFLGRPVHAAGCATPSRTRNRGTWATRSKGDRWRSDRERERRIRRGRPRDGRGAVGRLRDPRRR